MGIMRKDIKENEKRNLIIILFILLLASMTVFLIFKNKKDDSSNLITVSEYKSYLSTIDDNKLENVNLAKQKLLDIAKNQKLSTLFLDEFEQFLTTVGLNLNIEGINEEDLNNNGFIIEHNEGEITLELNYKYLYNNFKNKAAEVKVDYYNLKSTIYDYANSNHLYKDAELGVTWDQYRKILVLFDDYLKKHNQTTHQDEFNRLFGVYIGNPVLDNTPIYDKNNKLKAEIKESYEYLLTNNKIFSKYEEVKSHYNKYK